MPLLNLTPAQRIDAALSQLAPLDRMADLIAELRDAEIRHARTQSDDDYLNVLQLKDEYMEITADALGFNLDDERMWLADEAREACDYDLVKGDYITRPTPRVTFGDSHPDAGRGFRIGGAA